MANEEKKDFNAMLHDSKDMPKFQTITDQKSVEKYGGRNPGLPCENERRRFHGADYRRNFCLDCSLGRLSAHRGRDSLVEDVKSERRIRSIPEVLRLRRKSWKLRGIR